MNNSPDAMLDVYVPGAWRCQKCSFALQKATIFVQSGTIGSTREDVMNVTGEVCPNDGEPMLRETWHQRSEDNYKWGVGLMEEIITLTGAEHLPGAIETIKRLRADALAPPEPGWQPIETIPQDPCLIAWSEQRSELSLGGRRVEMIAGRREYEEVVGYGEPPATHWMPLPAPPKETR